jgi:hypothetical protein
MTSIETKVRRKNLTREEAKRRVLERNSETWCLRDLMFLRSQLHAFLSPCE